MLKSKRSRACDIPKKVKDKVWERDHNRCIICGSFYAKPNAHYIPRSKGGLGIEENIVTLCERCHYDYDHTTFRKEMGEYIEAYLKRKYPGWEKEKVLYKK